MSDEKIISGEQFDSTNKGGLIANENESVETNSQGDGNLETLEDRIVRSTESGGLISVPLNFDEQNGDWVIILSNDPFKVLYLDYRQYVFIKPSMVERNFTTLNAFWSNKLGVMNTGGTEWHLRTSMGKGQSKVVLQSSKLLMKS